MKKLFLFSVLALGAMTMNAQIELEAVINNVYTTNSVYCEDTYFDCGKLSFYSGDSVLWLYNDDMTLYKKITFPTTQSQNQTPRRTPTMVNGGPSDGFFCVTKNIFTTDNKIAFVRMTGDYELAIYNEDGELLKDFGSKDEVFGIIQVNGKYKFIIHVRTWGSGSSDTTEIYSLPGTGFVPTDDYSPSAPIRNINSQKIMDRGQVYIINNDSKYAITGSNAL